MWKIRLFLAQNCPLPTSFRVSVPLDCVEIKKKLEGEHAQLRANSILSVIPRERLLTKEENTVLYEGEVGVLRQECRMGYSTRWAQLTKNEFRYYKSQYSSTRWLARPLFRVSTHGLLHASRCLSNQQPSSKLPKECQQLVLSFKQDSGRRLGDSNISSIHHDDSAHSSSERCLTLSRFVFRQLS